MLSLWIIFCCLLFDSISAQENGSCSLQGIIQGEKCFRCADIQCDTPTPSNENGGKTLIYLFICENGTLQTEPECLHNCNYTLPTNTKFNPNCRTVIIFHGYIEGPCSVAWPRELAYQICFREKCVNIIIVDWTWGNRLDLLQTSINVPITAGAVIIVVRSMMSHGASPGNFLCFGLSFGAHCCGIIGKNIPGFGYITGCDPAYYAGPNNERLYYTDAELVQVMHTGSDNCLILGFGNETAVGHADFYVNGGLYQISCIPFIIDSFRKGDFLYAFIILIPEVCSHEFCVQYFKASVNPCNCLFIGGKCGNTVEEIRNDGGKCLSTKIKDNCNNNCECAVMGYDFDKFWMCGNTTNNLYYVSTVLECPYCKKYNVTLNPQSNQTDAESHCFPTGNKNYAEDIFAIFYSFIIKSISSYFP